MRRFAVVLLLLILAGCATCPPCRSVSCNFDTKVMTIDGKVYK
jgi:hypothetical protein